MPRVADMDTLGGRVRGLRKAKGWTQTTLKDKSGVAQSTIAEIETGTNKGRKIAAPTIARLAKALGTNYTFLLTGKESPVEPEVPSVEEAELLAIYRELERVGKGSSLLVAARGMLDVAAVKPSKASPFSKPKAKAKVSAS